MGHAELVDFLITKYFSNMMSVLIIYNSTWVIEKNELYLDAVQASFQNLSRQGLVVGIHMIDTAGMASGKQEDFKELLLQHSNLAIEGFITILPCLAEFLAARVYATDNSMQRLKDKYYLFLSDYENPEDVLKNEILKRYPHHLFVSALANSSSLTLWTQKFIGTEDNLKPIHLDTFQENGQFLKNVDLYPDKIHNMHGRVVEIASITYIPYVISYSVPEGTGHLDNLDPKEPRKSVIYTGSEADVVVTFCKLRNCVLRVIPYGNDYWGGIYENGSSDGMLGSVYRHETEFGIGCAYNWFYDIFETSSAIAKSAVLILAPAPSLYPAYMTIILPFNKLIWSLIILSIFASAIVMHVIMYFTSYMENRNVGEKHHFDHSSYELTQFQMVAIFFQQSFSQTKLDGFAARFFLSTLLLAGITLENTYSGQLKSLLTVPAVTEPVDTMKKFAATNWKWAAPSDAWIYSVLYSDIPDEKILVNNFQAMSYEDMRDGSYRRDFGSAVELLHGGTYSFGGYITEGNLENQIMTKDEIYYDYTRGFARKGWPLMPSFNTHILWCLEHGLYNYWEKKHVYHYLDKKTQSILQSLASGHMQKYPPIPLTIANISGPLYALAIGYGFAMVVLAVEIFARKSKAYKFNMKTEQRNGY